MNEKIGNIKQSAGKALAEQADRLCKDYGVTDPPDLIVETGENVVLSYESTRFRPYYREVRPQSVDEVRNVMGVSQAVAEQAGGGHGCRCQKVSRLVGEADLQAEDADIRGRALSLTRATMRTYVMGAATVSASQKAVLDKYVQITGPILHLAFFRDIVVNNGATLTVAGNTHTVSARKIRIHGSGRIVCNGPTTFNCASVEGDYNRGPSVFGPITAPALARSV